MDKRIKRLWLAALRGGLYKQGRYYLRDKHNCCCPLGVLCDVVDSSGWRKENSGWPHNTVWWIHGEQLGAPSSAVMLKAKLSEGEASWIVRMSDYDRCSFKQIANWVEVNL
jgi:hypothetical protein